MAAANVQNATIRRLLMHWDVAIIGGGPAGLMAAARAAQRGRNTILLDKNRRPGAKILLSGGTRCNLTHQTDAKGIVEAFGPNGRFLHSALAALGPQQVVDLFESEGVPTKVEPGGKVFPASDRALDVCAALVRMVERSGAALALSEPLLELTRTSGAFLLQTTKRTIEANKVVLATGGQSYPACGTTGDGYRWAEGLGHRIVPPHTALVPVTSHAEWVLALQGITLPDVLIQVVDTDRGIIPARSRGALLFAHFGITGPAVLDVSHAVSGSSRPSAMVLRCDLLPEVAENELDALLAGQCAAGGKKRLATLLDIWLPHRIGETLLDLIQIPANRPVAELAKADRRRLVQKVKGLDIPVSGTMGFRKAEVTAGGVALDQIDSRTMESRLVPNLFFAGELLDLNGPIGGYNFQAAFSTGWLAGESV
jgi:predicted Rossmann fold flavoprotein